MEITINGLKVQVEGAESQFFFDPETNTLKVQVKQKVVEKIKIVNVPGKETVKVVASPPVVINQPVFPHPYKPYYPWPHWEKWSLCTHGQVIRTTT